ncbi:MAG: GHKL domain-containing protein [Lachnospiraceae bacterium]|nr:GHKL domain-containing protein [Lachnospiraceae bacterium]
MISQSQSDEVITSGSKSEIKSETRSECRRLEEKYYKDLEKLHEQYDIFIHDMKHTMRTIAALSEEGNCEEISHIIGQMRIAIGNIDEQLICSNKILNALFNERKGYAKDNGVDLYLEISEPLFLQGIDELDLITLMGNLLDNAIEAEKSSDKPGEVCCYMRTAGSGRHIVIQVENSFLEKRRSEVEPVEMKSRKQSENQQIDMENSRMNIGERHGIGLKSVNEVVKRYGGILDNYQSDGKYIVKIILPVQVEIAEEISYKEALPAYAQSAYK